MTQDLCLPGQPRDRGQEEIGTRNQQEEQHGAGESRQADTAPRSVRPLLILADAIPGYVVTPVDHRVPFIAGTRRAATQGF
jgi:hypothetical protein